MALLSLLALSAFGSGVPPLFLAAGMLGVGVGFAGMTSPNTNAVAATLPRDEVGVGIYQMLFFLGAGVGPALLGAFIAARRESDTGAPNPLYILDDASFPDAFLLLGLCSLAAFLAAIYIQSPGNEP